MGTHTDDTHKDINSWVEEEEVRSLGKERKWKGSDERRAREL